MTIIIARLIILALATAGGVALGNALGLASPWPFLALAGFAVGVGVLLVERGFQRVPVERIVWASLGTLFGLVLGHILGAVIQAFVPSAAGPGRALLALLLGYLGGAVALRKSEELEGLSAVLFPKVAARRDMYKILDTSVIIDGRIADICETGFLEGTLIVPQFVLRELQQIADSSDGLKRTRGKRGFDVLQKIQRIPKVKVQIHDLDFPQVREVDRKLIEVAKALGGKVITNDYNLNKVAELSGVSVLNINELANSLKPVVLPGELMHVHVLKEGKESGQGVAYLDDGTMVVVDHGRKYLGQSVDVTVTSVLQTSAGRMIFTRLKEEEAVSGGRG
ncbi:MAG: TRAM domain-containing protein [Candidatus Rokubacteria bacterium]|nr:TRAM domain-containing protein [Candidatus Rokubacteria bacterium]